MNQYLFERICMWCICSRKFVCDVFVQYNLYVMYFLFEKMYVMYVFNKICMWSICMRCIFSKLFEKSWKMLRNVGRFEPLCTNRCKCSIYTWLCNGESAFCWSWPKIQAKARGSATFEIICRGNGKLRVYLLVETKSWGFVACEIQRPKGPGSRGRDRHSSYKSEGSSTRSEFQSARSTTWKTRGYIMGGCCLTFKFNIFS